jgi:hypothetical protein
VVHAAQREMGVLRRVIDLISQWAHKIGERLRHGCCRLVGIPAMGSTFLSGNALL